MGVSKFQRVMVGDSILRLTEGLLQADDSFYDFEDGRGIIGKGTLGRMSATEAVRYHLPMVEPDGYFVFQENGLNATVTQWTSLMTEIVARCPSTVTLIGVLPVAIAPLQQYTSEVAAKANIMVQKFNIHPLVEYVRWNQRVNAFPSYVSDGQHPSQEGQEWLGTEINDVTGF